MPADQIEALSESHERRISQDLERAFADYLANIDIDHLATSLDDIDANHIRDQLALQLDLDETGQPAPVLDALLVTLAVLASFAGAVAALASAQARHTLNPHNADARSLRDAAPGFMNQFIAQSVQAIRGAIETAIYSTDSVHSRAALLKQSIGLSVRQVETLDVMHGALMEYVSTPVRRVPGRIDGNGKRTPATFSRDADANAILLSTRGHISAAQRRILAKAFTDSKLTEAGAIAILDKHADAMRRFRIRAAVGEGIHALSENAKLTGWQIAQALGALPAGQRRYWRTAGDERVRHAHAQVPGKNRQGVELDQPFATALGPRMYPPLEYGCRCRAVLRGTQ